VQAKIYTNSDNPLWDSMKHEICQNILDNNCSVSTPKYYIHFDKMLFTIGWFSGFVELWKGKKPKNRNHWKIQFVIKVTDWGNRNDCPQRVNYRMVCEGN